MYPSLMKIGNVWIVLQRERKIFQKTESQSQSVQGDNFLDQSPWCCSSAS